MNAFKTLGKTSKWITTKKCNVIPQKNSLYLARDGEIALNHFTLEFFSNFYIYPRFYLLICRAGATVNLSCPMPVTHAGWMDYDGLFCFNNWRWNFRSWDLLGDDEWELVEQKK